LGTTSRTRQVSLEEYHGQWDESDKDANFKQEVATYTRVDPMPTIDAMSRNLRIPVGAIARYVLVKWATSGSAALLKMGPRVVQQMAEVVRHAESKDTDMARLQAYQKLSQIISWLNIPLVDPGWRPGNSEEEVSPG